LLGGGDAAAHGGGQGVAEQGAAVPERELFAGGQDGPVRGLPGHPAHLRNEGDGLFQGEALGLVRVLKRHRYRRHPSPSQEPGFHGWSFYKLHLPKSRGAPDRIEWRCTIQPNNIRCCCTPNLYFPRKSKDQAA
jgi:hypothetical protein